MVNGSNEDQPGLSSLLAAWSSDLELLRQNNLMDEGQFLTFSKNCGLPTYWRPKGDASEFANKGWLTVDGRRADNDLQFHPFRLYTFHCLLRCCDLGIATTATLSPQRFVELAEFLLANSLGPQQFKALGTECDELVDLAILLEPVCWPTIVGQQVIKVTKEAIDPNKAFDAYRTRALQLVSQLDEAVWRRKHETLRIQAGFMDENRELYLLLRAAKWEKRETLRGSIAGALWTRHIGEVIRRAFEQAHSVSWPEEDECFGLWFPHARKFLYGSERPIDDPARYMPNIALSVGVYTGSAVRWYVEGHTENFAIREILGDPSRYGIELLNLRGNIQSGTDNAALKLQEWLIQDKECKRFSILSFDTDVSQNKKFVRRQVEQNNIVGLIDCQVPDFEFSNFAVNELVEIAAQIDERQGYPGDPVRKADWHGVDKIAAFEKKYLKVSLRKPSSLKDEPWGRALGSYATKHPIRNDVSTVRTVLKTIEAALRCRFASHQAQSESFYFDPFTFGEVRRDTL